MILSTQQEVLNYIPQREPIVMVSALVSASKKGIETEVVVCSDNMFVIDKKWVSAYGVLEHIAQSYALAHSYINKDSGIGLIGRVKNLKVEMNAEILKPIKSTITILHDMGSTVLIKANAEQENKNILSCEMYLHFNN
jgi:hypothetical protein|tara:strand:+ start:7448 stop:7861 length:414 start_codon:yes stop_codon:yes gene_type:complete